MINLPVFSPKDYAQGPTGLNGILQQALATYGQLNQFQNQNDQHAVNQQALRDSLIKSQFLPQQLQQQQQHQNLANQLLGINVQDQPDINQAKIKNLNTLSDYRGSDAAAERGLSTLGKILFEKNKYGKDNDQLSNQYDAAAQKVTSDKSTRDKVKYAQNIEKTINSIDPSIIKDYSGPEGYARLAKDFSSQFNGDNDRYDKYNDFVKVKVPIIVSQIRQFYGDSVQPSVKKELEEVANPISWKKSPHVAMKQFESLVSLLENEADTYRSNLNNPLAANSKLSNARSIPDNSWISVISPEGKAGRIHPEDREEALKNGYKIRS